MAAISTLLGESIRDPREPAWRMTLGLAIIIKPKPVLLEVSFQEASKKL